MNIIMSIIITIFTVLLLTIFIISIVKGKPIENFCIKYKLKSLNTTRIFNYILHVTILLNIILLTYTIVVNKDIQYYDVVTRIFWIMGMLVYLICFPFPRNYYLSEIGIISYGVIKRITRVHKWKQVNEVTYDNIDGRIEIDIIENGFDKRLVFYTIKGEEDEILGYISTYSKTDIKYWYGEPKSKKE